MNVVPFRKKLPANAPRTICAHEVGWLPPTRELFEQFIHEHRDAILQTKASLSMDFEYTHEPDAQDLLFVRAVSHVWEQHTRRTPPHLSIVR